MRRKTADKGGKGHEKGFPEHGVCLEWGLKDEKCRRGKKKMKGDQKELRKLRPRFKINHVKG